MAVDQHAIVKNMLNQLQDRHSLIKDSLAKNGYAVIDVKGLCQYTVGLGLKGKSDLISFPHYPEGFFQMAVSKYANNEVELDKGFFLHEYQMETEVMGKEPARCKLFSLDFGSIQDIVDTIAPLTKQYKLRGLAMVLGPDKNNFLPDEPQSQTPFDPNELIVKMAQATKTEVAGELNKAMELLKSFGKTT